MPTQPPLSAASADRNASVVEAADAYVDNGMTPDAALAKAAAEYGMPAGHVPLVVRAFNTARAVRQLEERDPWAKAAAYPTATEGGVRAHLEAPPEPPASKSAADDYALPPDFGLPGEPPPVFSGREKSATAAPAAAKPKAAAEKDRRLEAQFAAAHAFDKLARTLRAASGPEYAGVKRLAARFHPDVAMFAFGELEEDPSFFRKASAAPSPAVPADHPALALVAELGRLRAEYPRVEVPAAPEGYRKVASEFGRDLYVKAPPPPPKDPFAVPALESVKAAIDPYPIDPYPIDPSNPGRPAPTPPGPAGPLSLMTPISSPVAAPPAVPAPPPAPVQKAPTAPPVPPSPQPPAAPAPKAAAEDPRGGFWGSFKAWGGTGGAMKPLALAARSAYSGPAVDVLRASNEAPAKAQDSAIAGAGSALRTNLARLDSQAAIQSLLEDPRFSKADPRTVVDAYHQLSNIAPLSMANPAIAADYINRRLQTGPPSYYDLKALTDIEKSLAQIRSYNTRPADDEE